MNKKKLFDYNLEVLQVSQLAAISVFDFIGKKDETAADKAAVESMRKELNKINFKGTIVIGEGERDKAPMLYIGEKVGNGNALEVDIALDPLEGTRITATNEKNALTVLAVGDKNSFLHAPDVYMEKIAIGPNLPNTFLDLDMPLEETLENIAKYKKKRISDIGVCVLNRPRHKKIFDILDKFNCKKLLIPDGDIAGVISTAIKKNNIDMYIGTGGAPEGVLAAAALKCIDGQMQCRLLFNNDLQKERAKKMGIKNLNRKYNINDMVKGDVIFCATGVTNGDFVKGIYDRGDYFEAETYLLHKSSNTNKIIKNSIKK